MSAKNCHTCLHLEYETGDEYGNGSGLYCAKRDPASSEAASKLLKDMAREEYLNRYKRCFELKPLTYCAASRDGECSHAQCPQQRDNEPAASGRHCPLDNHNEED